jgi:hypothetical protein
MYLPNGALKSIFNAVSVPTNGDPTRVIHVSGEKEQREFLEGWCKEIENAKNNCSAHVTPASHGKPQMTVDVHIDTPSRYSVYSSSHSLRLTFVNDELRVGSIYAHNLYIALTNIEQLWQLIESLRKKLNERNAREQKQQKIRDLKTRSIETQIEDLAQRLQFAYQLTRKHTKVILAVKLDPQRCLFVDIPLGKIQETIERLESLIEQVRVLYAEGLRFKIAQAPYGHFQQPKPAE